MLISWLLYPLLLTAASLGQGLLVRRVLRGPSDLLLLPVGFALMIAATTALIDIGLYKVAWLGIVVPTVAGYALSVPWLRERRRQWPARETWLWPLLAALFAFVAYAAPVVFSGRLTFTGFSMITDIANHFDLAAQMTSAGQVAPTPVDSSFAESIRKLLGASYPTGMHSLLGAWSQLLGRELAWMYQPTITFAAPMGALAAFGVLRWAGLSAPLRALAAAVVVQPTLLYSYGLVAGFKELFAAVMILITVALLAEGFDRRDRRVFAAAIPILAGYDAFSLAIAPWLGLVVGVFVIAWLLRLPQVARHVTVVRVVAGAVVVIGLALLILPSFPLSGGSLSSQPGVKEVVTSQTDLGNLAAPLDRLTSVGVWMTGDYRFPLTTHVGLTHALIYLVLLLAALGIVSILWRRRPEIAALAVAGGLVFAVILPKTGPWVDAKIYAVTGTIVLSLAFFGIGALLTRKRLAPVGWVLAGLVALGVLYGNALAYHNTTLAPESRLSELERISHRFAGKGPALAPEFNEYAEYFLRNLKTTGRVNPPNGFPGSPPNFGTDIDQPDNVFIESFPLLVLRRGPQHSRPPGNYELAYRGRFYDVWRRAFSGGNIIHHESTPGPLDQRPAKNCRGLAKAFDKTPGGKSVRWAIGPDPAVFVPTTGKWSPGWVAQPDGSSLRTTGPGKVRGTVTIKRPGRYEVWQMGSFERPVEVIVDGRTIATLSGLSDYPAEAAPVTTVALEPGRHTVELRRGGGSLAPGNGDVTGSRYVGPTYFLRPQDAGGQIFTSSIADTFKVCRSHRVLDWVELLNTPS